MNQFFNTNTATLENCFELEEGKNSELIIIHNESDVGVWLIQHEF